MGTASVQCLTNSISRFIHLVSCHTTKPLPLPKKCRNLVVVLKLLKLVLDDVISLKLSSDELLYSECESLDTAVNEAREFIENWSPKTSKICSVSYLENQPSYIPFFFSASSAYASVVVELATFFACSHGISQAFFVSSC